LIKKELRKLEEIRFRLVKPVRFCEKPNAIIKALDVVPAYISNWLDRYHASRWHASQTGKYCGSRKSSAYDPSQKCHDYGIAPYPWLIWGKLKLSM